MPLARFIFSFIAFIIGIVLVIPVIVLALPILLVASVGKIGNALKPKTSDWEDIIQFDPILGWRAKPNVRTRMNTEGVYKLTTGSDGWRGNYSLKNCDVVVIGDSFVFGQGADDSEHFALHAKAKVKPVGAPGYGATHYLLLLKQLSHELRGKLVIWFVFTGNDYREAVRPTSYGYHFPFTFYDSGIGNYKIQTDNVQPKKLPFNFEKGYKTSMPELADLYYKNYLSDYTFGVFEYLATEAKSHCEKYGAKFAITTIPLWWASDKEASKKITRHCGNAERFSPTYPDEQTAAICARHAIPFRAGTGYYAREDFLREDFHWSHAGNRKAASVIEEMRNLLFPIKPAKIKP